MKHDRPSVGFGVKCRRPDDTGKVTKPVVEVKKKTGINPGFSSS
jgi:hypothetical protein